jgi:hypothetical protein
MSETYPVLAQVELVDDRQRESRTPRQNLKDHTEHMFDIVADVDLRYAELHCHTNFSFLDGASHPEDLVERAVELGYQALAVTDHNGFYGAVRFSQAAREAGLPAVYGVEIGLEKAEDGSRKPIQSLRPKLAIGNAPRKTHHAPRCGPAGAATKGCMAPSRSRFHPPII